MLFGGQPFIADMTAYALDNPISTAATMRRTYQARAARFAEALSRAPGLTPLSPEAGMFIVVDVSQTGMSGEDFAWALLREEGIAVMPGSSFGEQAAGFIRLSLTVPDTHIDEACRRIAALAARSTLPKERRA
jgi:arginine:pyruvate transaminase